jgi:hypothetical protein
LKATAEERELEWIATRRRPTSRDCTPKVEEVKEVEEVEEVEVT